ncbi:putative nadh:flavin oxidoreductase nadh oxidase family protein [Neofusicoccum parvum UCRNP2]|uniref:Putative nadh:flavin oxidoreductase nadh oxidase family protein n=1 Tax=Botryosphaeria parva (strain UCR-NP2) TaxID=1287680 RepID=R1EE14_BOTPV|nr:putative nadh:flavin oxidoreductase nadh oxidase family protein [Neofusicoccum parvum UCRNP2]
MAASSKLFTPFKVGSSQLEHRIVMAPLTRLRAEDNHVPTPLMADYYAQRSSVPGTLLITEATFISQRAGGLPNIPGLWTEEQLAGWKKVTDAVHVKGSKIWVQLWALGRAANPEVLEKEGLKDQFVSSSAVPMGDGSPTPRALSEEEIQSYIQDYAQAAKNAVEKAGFDGVEVHGANGYLVDQFSQDTSNKRTDRWGGSVENRARFGLEVSRAVSQAVGPEKTGIRLSPWSTFQGMRMENPVPQFTHIIKGLKELDIAYIHVVESRVSGNADVESSDRLDFALEAWGKEKPVLIAGGLRPDSARRLVDEEYKDYNAGTVFGRYFISTPDLVYRIRQGIELNPYNRDTFYKPKSADGYVDYPFSREFEAEQRR